MKATSNSVRIGALVIAMTTCGLLSGCRGHYQVTDPTSGRVYYTRHIKDQRNGGIEFDDAKTGNRVTLQNSEVAKLSGSEYKNAVNAGQK